MVEHIFWDWHGVIGLEKLWQRPSRDVDAIKQFSDFAFSDADRVARWMRGQVRVEDLIAEMGSPLTRGVLVRQTYEGWPGKAWINVPLFEAIRALAPGRSHSVVTDNVDVFTDYLRQEEWLSERFSTITNSADFGCLKADPQSLLEIAAARSGTPIGGTLLIDDSHANCSRFRELGGQAIQVPHWARREPGQPRT